MWRKTAQSYMILNRFFKKYYLVQLSSELRMGRNLLTSINLQWGMAEISSMENKDRHSIH